MPESRNDSLEWQEAHDFLIDVFENKMNLDMEEAQVSNLVRRGRRKISEIGQIKKISPFYSLCI